jgi:hypothetical protein
LYEILRDKIRNEKIDKERILQMIFKTINDTAGPDRIVLTLLVFEAYLYLTEMNLLSLTVIKRAETIYTVIKEICQLQTERQVKNVLAIHNSLKIKITLDLLLQSDI